MGLKSLSMCKMFKFIKCSKCSSVSKSQIYVSQLHEMQFYEKILGLQSGHVQRTKWLIVPMTKTLRVRTSPGTKSSTLNSLAMRTSLQLLATSSVSDQHIHKNHHFDRVFVFRFAAIVIVTKVLYYVFPGPLPEI